MDEMKKYIIEFSEDPHTIRLMKLKNGNVCPTTEFKTVTPYTEPDTGKIREKAYEEGYTRGAHDAKKVFEDHADEAYRKGLNDAWAAARKIESLSAREFDKAFTGYDDCFKVFENYTPQEAIDKIQQYEQKQEQQTQIGDEVEGDFGIGMVTKPLEGGAYIMWKDGSSGSHTANEFKLTGRNFPELAEILRKMKEK